MNIYRAVRRAGAPLFMLVFCLVGGGCGGETKLFNEKNLDNWIQTGAAPWRVSGKQLAVSAAGGDGMLVTREKYGNFKLSLEFWVDERVNSGVFIRCLDPEKITPFDCYEINIWDRHPKQEYRTGSVVTLVSPPLAQVDTIGQWNRCEIIAAGDSILETINGAVTARLLDGKLANGHIALQRFNGGEVRFRNIVLEVLPSGS